jgi:hypothetical protein
MHNPGGKRNCRTPLVPSGRSTRDERWAVFSHPPPKNISLVPGGGTKGPHLSTGSSSSSPPSLDLCFLHPIHNAAAPNRRLSSSPWPDGLASIYVRPASRPHLPSDDRCTRSPSHIDPWPSAHHPTIRRHPRATPVSPSHAAPPAMTVRAGRTTVVHGQTRARVPCTINLPAVAPPSSAWVTASSTRGLLPVLVRAVR